MLAFELTGEPVSNALTPWLQALRPGRVRYSFNDFHGIAQPTSARRHGGRRPAHHHECDAGSIIGTWLLALVSRAPAAIHAGLQFRSLSAVLFLLLDTQHRQSHHRRRHLQATVLVYGAGNNAARIHQLRRRNDKRGFNVVGYMQAQIEERAIPAETNHAARQADQ